MKIEAESYSSAQLVDKDTGHSSVIENLLIGVEGA